MEKFVVGDFLSWRSFAQNMWKVIISVCLTNFPKMNLSVLTRGTLFIFCMTTW